MRLIGTLLSTCLFLLLHNLDLKAQEQLGLRTDNYSGVNSIMLNPSNFVSSKLDWDVNVIGVGAFGETNYGYIYNTNVIDIMRKVPNVTGAFDIDEENEVPDSVLITDYYDTFTRQILHGANHCFRSFIFNKI